MSAHLSPEELSRAAAAGERPAHAAACPRCARAYGRHLLLAGLRQQEGRRTLEDAAFARVERRALEAAAQPTPRWGRGWVAVPLAVAALAAVAYVALVPPRAAAPSAPVAEAPPRAPAPAPGVPAATASVSWVEGSTRRDGAALAVREGLHEGDRLSTGDGVLRVELPSGGRCVLEANTTVALASLKPASVALKVEAGRLGCQVPALQAGQTLTVDAAGRRVSVVGTLFAVGRFASEVVVDVSEGTVSVSDGPLFGAPRLLRAPASLRLADGAPLSGPAAPAAGPLARAGLLSGPLPAGEPAAVKVAGLPAGAEVQLDELGWGRAPLEGLISPGRHRVRARQEGKQGAESWVSVASGAGPFEVKLPALQPVLPDRTADPEAIAEVNAALRAHAPQMRLCYERWLKRNEAAGGRVVLTLELSAHGAVVSARADGAVMPEVASRCLAEAARKWALPALGAPVELEVPLELTAAPER